jgi:hypothetical protein
MSNNNAIISGLPSKEYRSRPGANASFLKKFAISPLYAANDDFESSAATDLGEYIHALTIDPASLENFACLPTTGEGSKKAREAWRAEHPDGVLLSPSAMENGKAAAASLKSYPYFGELMSMDGIDTEVSLFCKHPKYGFPMKARIDILANPKDGSIIIGDVKSYGKPLTKKTLFWDIRDRGYDIQLVHYRRCLQIIENRSPDEMALYFVESETKAHDCVKVTLDEGWLAHAEHRLDEYYRIYNECQESGVYPGFNFGSPLHLTLGDNLS